MNLKRILCAAAWLAATTLATAQTWSDVTNRFITNPAFDNNSSDGWTWESDANTQEVRVNCISFYAGNFDLHQQLTGLPRGTYRLTVQGFYRTTDNGTAYNEHQNGTEIITASAHAAVIATIPATTFLISPFSSVPSSPARTALAVFRRQRPERLDAAEPVVLAHIGQTFAQTGPFAGDEPHKVRGMPRHEGAVAVRGVALILLPPEVAHPPGALHSRLFQAEQHLLRTDDRF